MSNTQIEKLQKLAESKFELKATKLTMLERVDSQLLITHNGGLFKATPSLITFLSTFLLDHGPASSLPLVLLDEYDNPIIVNPIELKSKAWEANQFALNAYLEEYNELKKVRKGDKL